MEPTKKAQFEENLLDQAIQFFYKSCKKGLVDGPGVSPPLCEISRSCIWLNNRFTKVAKVRYSKTHLYVNVGGAEYKEKIKDPITNYSPVKKVWPQTK